MDPTDENRDAKRQAVLKTAKIIWGSSVVDCLVVEQSTTGVRVSLAIPMVVPKQVTIHLGGGAVRSATQRWTLGTEIGFEFVGAASLDDKAAGDALAILADLRETGLHDILARLAAVRFFDDAELSSTAFEAQAAMHRLEAALRRRADRAKK